MKKILTLLGLVGGSVCVIKGLENKLVNTKREIYSAKIPQEFVGFKIVQVSDYHSSRVLDLGKNIALQNPDIIAVTGDMANDNDDYDDALGTLSELTKIAPVIMVTGNHDIWRSDYTKMEEQFISLGVRVIHNKKISITRNENKINIYGIDDPYYCDTDKIKKFINDKLDTFTIEDEYNILLFHRANCFDMIKNAGFDLILAGHMHGGLIRIPLLGGVGAPRSSFCSGNRVLFPKYCDGVHTYKNTTMIVSRGIGNMAAIPRFNNPSEFITITLHKK